MILNSAMNEGLSGMQHSQKRMQQAAEDIVKAGMPTDHKESSRAPGGTAPVSNNGTAATDLPGSLSVSAVTQNEGASVSSRANSGDVVEPLIEQRRQQVLFDASAKVVSVASQTIGSLIDDLS